MARRHAPQNTVRRHAAQNEGQSPKRAGIFGVAPDLPPKGPIWRDDAWQSVADNAVLKTQTGGWRSLSGEVQNGRRSPLARKIGIMLHRMWIAAQPTGVPKRSRSRRRLDQGGIGDASGPNRGPYCPKSRRRNGGAGEAVTRPVAVIRRTTREGHESQNREASAERKEMTGRRLSQEEAKRLLANYKFE